MNPMDTYAQGGEPCLTALTDEQNAADVREAARVALESAEDHKMETRELIKYMPKGTTKTGLGIALGSRPMTFIHCPSYDGHGTMAAWSLHPHLRPPKSWI